MLILNSDIPLNEEEIHYTFIPSSGPGGQNVNKVATTCQLRLDVCASPSLPQEIKLRLGKLAGRRMTREGVLIIEARRYRSQERNREDARQRLLKLIAKAMQPPKKRIRTRPSASSREKRLHQKKIRSEKKKQRSKPAGDV
jgi:ribosome-associated protein